MPVNQRRAAANKLRIFALSIEVPGASRYVQLQTSTPICVGTISGFLATKQLCATRFSSAPVVVVGMVNMCRLTIHRGRAR